MKNSGFTLIEMMVAVALFATVMSGSLAALLSVISAQNRTQSLRVINDNLNFSLEAMLREIRSGSGYSINLAGDSLSFTNLNSQAVTYTINGERIQRIVGISTFNLTSPETIITKLNFKADGQASGDDKQPRVTIYIEGYTGYIQKEKSELKLQTTISQRKLDS